MPVDRLRSYDVRSAIDLLFDTGSVLELRRDFGVGMITALARVEGRPVGVIANNPAHLAGAIDSDGSDKAARFMQLCDAHGLPIVTLVDTPGMMVGPEVEATALVRHCSRLFVTGANVSVPMMSVVLRKSYGLGAQAMMGGSTKAPLACVSWPTGEFGGMGLEGAVRLGYRKELEACADDAERDALFHELVDRLVRVRQGAADRRVLRDRRRDRSGRHPPLDHRPCSNRRRLVPTGTSPARTSTPGERPVCATGESVAEQLVEDVVRLLDGAHAGTRRQRVPVARVRARCRRRPSRVACRLSIIRA